MEIAFFHPEMDGSKSLTPDQARELIARIEAACKDAEAVRAQVEQSLRQRPFWPERRRVPRVFEKPDAPPDRGDSE